MNRAIVKSAVEAALAEDVGAGDLTSEAVVPAGAWASAVIIARQDGVIAGMPVAHATFQQLDPHLNFTAICRDGNGVKRDATIARIDGAARSILTAERTALNFLQRLSGIATAAAAYVQACEGTSACIVDTRKTAPGLRVLDKYAVRIGGARNHRSGLDNGILIKENHIRAGGGIQRAVTAARTRAPFTLRVEVECDTLAQVDEALAAGADIILLDNMSTEEMARAVQTIGGRALTEASGNMRLERIAEVAATGVDMISVGALTHSVTALDLSLEIISWRLPGELSA